MGKIRTLIAHDDLSITNNIVNTMKELDYVEVVGTSKDEQETYNKIISLQPEMVFVKFDIETMNVIKIAQMSKEKLENKLPIFNFITTNITQEQLKEATDVIGKKLSSLVAEPTKDRIINIMQDYKEYRYKETL